MNKKAAFSFVCDLKSFVELIGILLILTFGTIWQISWLGIN
jgi:hypothetical protein